MAQLRCVRSNIVAESFEGIVAEHRLHTAFLLSCCGLQQSEVSPPRVERHLNLSRWTLSVEHSHVDVGR